MTDDWKTDDVEALFEAILRLETVDETERFFRDLCTLGELRDMAQRWAVVRMLDSGPPLRRDLARGPAPAPRRSPGSRRGSTTARAATARCSTELDASCALGTSPYPVAARSMTRPPPPRGPEQGPPRRADAARCCTMPASCSRSTIAASSRASRTSTWTSCSSAPTTSSSSSGDGVADLGITGADLLHETGAELPVVRPLGYGRCRLAAAVPPTRPIAPSRTWPARGSRRRIRTRPAASSPSAAIPVEIIPISGAVEVAPRLGLAEAIVDLVSTGSTLVMNGLRPIGDVLDLGGGPGGEPGGARERGVGSRRDGHDARGGPRRPRSQVPDDERARRAPGRARGASCRRSSRRRSSRSRTPG